MYNIFKQVVAIKNYLSKRMGRFAITSWLRPEGTHYTGMSFDLAPRFGKGYARRMMYKSPDYHEDEKFIDTFVNMLPELKRIASGLRIVAIEPNHIHLSWKPVEGVSDMNSTDCTLVVKDKTNTVYLKHKIQ